MSTSLSCQREHFSIAPGHVYLNCAYMGPLPRLAQSAGEQALAKRAFPVGISARDFFDPCEATRQLFGELVNASAERIAFVPTSSYASSTIAKNLEPGRGQNVVMLGEQFPSNVYPWRNWRERGVQMRMIDAPPGDDRAARWNHDLLVAIDENTALVALEQAHWTDGTLFDLVAIGKRARKVGAAYVIDATQTAGAMPIDFAAIRPDALIVHAYKSMLCNYGLGFMVLSDRFLTGSPLEENWLLRAGSEDFSNLLNYQDDYAKGARRFDSSTRANPTLIAMLEVCCKLLLQWQPDRIRDYLLRIERPFVKRVRELGFGVDDEAYRAANIFGLRLPSGLDAEQCRAVLAERRIHVSVRGQAVRISPHVYNDESDLESLADALADIVGR